MARLGGGLLPIAPAIDLSIDEGALLVVKVVLGKNLTSAGH
ncbi:hypothetical protein QUB47_19940 [Microcoleus sp. AT9_B5]